MREELHLIHAILYSVIIPSDISSRPLGRLFISLTRQLCCDRHLVLLKQVPFPSIMMLVS